MIFEGGDASNCFVAASVVAAAIDFGQSLAAAGVWVLAFCLVYHTFPFFRQKLSTIRRDLRFVWIFLEFYRDLRVIQQTIACNLCSI